ncbi:MAG: C13 family peptidase [Candidatus Woesearchaeota archaeon]
MKNLKQYATIGALLALGAAIPTVPALILNDNTEPTITEEQHYRNIHAIILSGHSRKDNVIQLDQAQKRVYEAYKILNAQGVDPENIHIFNNRINEETRLENLIGKTNIYESYTTEDALEVVKAIQTDEDSLLFVYVSGHGLLLPNNQPAIAWNTTAENNQTTNIPGKDFHEAVNSLPNKYKLTFFPACYGGDMVQLFADNNTIAISAAQPGNTSAFWDYERVFLKSFIQIDPEYYGDVEYIADAAGDKNNIVSFNEAYNYANYSASAATKRTQTPYMLWGANVPRDLSFEDF